MLYGLYKNKTGRSYNWWFGSDKVVGSDAWCNAYEALKNHYMVAGGSFRNKWMPEPVLVIPAEFTANESSKGEE